jgi:hypothetical protein
MKRIESYAEEMNVREKGDNRDSHVRLRLPHNGYEVKNARRMTGYRVPVKKRSGNDNLSPVRRENVGLKSAEASLAISERFKSPLYFLWGEIRPEDIGKI